MRVWVFPIIAIAVLASFSSGVFAGADPCSIDTAKDGNFTLKFFDTVCHSITPYYFKGAVTIGAAKVMLTRLGVEPISVITGGFNTNLPGLREPVDYVEIEGKVIVGRSEFWPILFESKTGDKPYLGIIRGEVISWKKDGNQWRPIFRDLPVERRWAIAAGPRIVIKQDKNDFTVEFYGNEPDQEPWLTILYRRQEDTVQLVKIIKSRPAKFWAQDDHKRYVYDWTQRRAVLLNQDGTRFIILSGRADALAIAKAMIIYGYSEALLMDGGSAVLADTTNPVYLAVTLR